MTVIAITGNIGAGKSSVENYIKREGFSVIDADDIVRELREQPDVIEELSRVTGINLGELSPEERRTELVRSVFFDNSKKALVENVFHPRVKERLVDFAKAHAGESLVFISVPLLFEVGWTDIADEILLVAANDNARISRLTEKRGLSEYEAVARIKSQIPQEVKIGHSDYVIFNNESEEKLGINVLKFLRSFSGEDRA